jgi:DNA-binding response OmpR family regulator
MAVPQPHIVLIQDNAYLVASRVAILKSRGYTVEVVQSVSEARTRCREFKCDLVIVDAGKAHNTALELCEEIKLNNPSVSVVMMAGFHVYLDTECPDEIVTREEGPEGFIAKVQNLLSSSAA